MIERVAKYMYLKENIINVLLAHLMSVHGRHFLGAQLLNTELLPNLKVLFDLS